MAMKASRVIRGMAAVLQNAAALSGSRCDWAS
jgi:hypothetical protein